MNQPAQPFDILPSRVSCLILSLADRRLLVPSTAVAEILLASERPEAGDRDLCYGWINWRSQRIPLLSFEVVLAGTAPPLGDTYRLAVFNAIGAAQSMGFYAVRLDAIPQSVQISAHSAVAPEKSTGKGILMEAMVGDERLAVPSLEAVERRAAAL